MNNDSTEWASVEQIAENPRYPFTEAQLRHYLLHRHKNGLQGACRKIGKRLYLRIDLLNAWIESQKEARNG